MKKNFVVLAVLATMFSCSKEIEIFEDNNLVEKHSVEKQANHIFEKEDYKDLSTEAIKNKMVEVRKFIDDKIKDRSCTGDVSDWAYTGLGELPCAGPSTYIAYSTKMDNLPDFLSKVDLYTDLNIELNKRNEKFGGCYVTLVPTAIKCVADKVELVYSKNGGDKPNAEDVTFLMEKQRYLIDSYLEENRCDADGNLEYVSFGANSCQGISSYIAYSKNMEHMSEFLESVNRYTKLNYLYNKLKGNTKACLNIQEPKKVVCDHGKPTLVF